MTCWALIPAKHPDTAKRRLEPALDPAGRARLVNAMLSHVVAVARECPGIDQVCMVGPSRHGLAEDIALLADPGGGLNHALASALGGVPDTVTRVLVLAGDLPRLSPDDLAALLAVPVDTAGIAPDRHGTGTNALSLPLPRGRGFGFAYGEGSCARHRRAAGQLGLAVMLVRSDGLAQDIDTPADLESLR